MSMLNGICPSCQSTEIYIKHDSNHHSIINIDIFSGFRPVLFVCTDCGYMAHFIAKEHLQDIRKKWRKWDPDNRKTFHKEKRKRKNDEKPNNVDEPEFIDISGDEYDYLFADEKPKRKPKRKRKNDEKRKRKPKRKRKNDEKPKRKPKRKRKND
jgi:hypothetical protein